jgi:hypothetical protein
MDIKQSANGTQRLNTILSRASSIYSTPLKTVSLRHHPFLHSKWLLFHWGFPPKFCTHVLPSHTSPSVKMCVLSELVHFKIPPPWQLIQIIHFHKQDRRFGRSLIILVNMVLVTWSKTNFLHYFWHAHCRSGLNFVPRHRLRKKHSSKEGKITVFIKRRRSFLCNNFSHVFSRLYFLVFLLYLSTIMWHYDVLLVDPK